MYLLVIRCRRENSCIHPVIQSVMGVFPLSVQRLHMHTENHVLAIVCRIMAKRAHMDSYEDDMQQLVWIGV